MPNQSGPLVLVTGASGFVGHHLCTALIQKGFRVRGTHRGRHPEIPGVEWIAVGNIGAETNWHQAMSGVMHVIHLAALAHKVGADEEKIRHAFRATNVEGTRQLLKSVVSMQLPGRFCHVSSSGAVCTLAEQIINDQTPCRPDSAYGQSKLESENVVQDALRSSGISWTIIRPALIYGPGNPGNMARLLRLIRTGFPLPLDGISNQRSFVFIGNLVDALIRCLEHPGAEREILAINDGVPISTPSLVRMIGRLSCQNVRIFCLHISMLRAFARFGDLLKVAFGRSVGLDTYSLDRLVGSHAVDATVAFRKLQWDPPFSMEEGLTLTLSDTSQDRKGRD